MADRRQISVANAILVTLSSLAAAFQYCGLILTYLILEKRRLQMVSFQIANQYDIAVARHRNAPKQICRRGRIRRKPGSLTESEWKKNFRVDRGVFMTLADELAPYLRPGRSPHGLIITRHSPSTRASPTVSFYMGLCQQKSTLTPKDTLLSRWGNPIP